jgi:hypothetical protein
MRENSTSEGGNYPPVLPVGLNLPESHCDFLHAAKLGHGTYYFTSPPKEGILRIFRMPEKSNGFGRVPLASMLTTRPPKPSSGRILTNKEIYAIVKNPTVIETVSLNRLRLVWACTESGRKQNLQKSIIYQFKKNKAER